MNRLITASTATLLLLAAASHAQQGTQDTETASQQQQATPETLAIGDTVPPLDNSAELEWVRGDTHTEWKKDNIYVLDFWATWCGPCIASMPHIIETQDKYKDDNVHVIGVHIWASDSSPTVTEFLNNSDLEFNYAMVRETDSWAAETYMDTTGSNGIPTVMIVNGEGKLAWIGHPMSMDEPLAQIVKGEYDLEAAAEADRERVQQAMQQRRMQELLSSDKGQELQQRLRNAMNAGEYREMYDTFGELIALDPELLARFHGNRYRIAAIQLENEELANQSANDILTSPAADDPDVLNAFAWTIVAPGSSVATLDFDQKPHALRAAKRAAELTEHKDGDVLDTLARAHFVSGNYQQALDTQRKALEMAQESGASRQLINQLQQRLDEYQQAVNTG